MTLQKYRTIVQRLAAAIIDGILFIPVSLALGWLFQQRSSWSTESPVLWLDGGLWILYRGYMHHRFGQTLGKMFCRVKVLVMDETKYLDFGSALLRELPWAITAAINQWIYPAFVSYWQFALFPQLVDALILLFHPKQRALHDLLAGSVVVDSAQYRKWDFEYQDPGEPPPSVLLTAPPDTMAIEKIFKVPPDRLFEAWTLADQAVQWFGSDPHGTGLSASIDARVAKGFDISFQDSDGSTHRCFGVYRAVLKPALLVFSWNWESEPGVETIVTVRIQPHPLGSRMQFEHSGLVVASTHDYARGWESCFRKLEKFLMDN